MPTTTPPTVRTASTDPARQALALRIESLQCFQWETGDPTTHAILAGSCIHCDGSIDGIARRAHLL
jgi:hypothetical protein